jgi:hypothetical protein
VRSVKGIHNISIITIVYMQVRVLYTVHQLDGDIRSGHYLLVNKQHTVSSMSLTTAY